jgi:N-acyl-D-aspartate/D-glutamate deacylase
MYDLVIRNALLVDGAGGPAQAGDLAVKDGRIARIAPKIAEAAERVVDAEGQALAPGFVDCHTHYDAQLFWDPTISPSSQHGVTTVLAGNCGFSIAPLSREAAPYLLRMLARVEGMPQASLEAGVPWDWESFGDYLARVEGRIGLNMGFMCGHSALRRVVMGERAVGQEATADELEQMKRLLARSLSEGAMGFSSTISESHNDAEGLPVPSRHATREELVALARVCRDHPGTLLELLPGVERFGDYEMGLMTEMSLAAERSLNWNAISVGPGNEAFVAHQVATADYARKAGADVVGLAMVSSPMVRLNLYSGFFFDTFDGWGELFKLSIPDRIAVLKDPERRRELDRRAVAGMRETMKRFCDWANFVVVDSRDRSVVGLKVGELAQRQGKTPIDAMMDVAISDGLRTVFETPPSAEGEQVWKRRAELWRDDRTVVGASDAGAHLDMIDAFAFSSHLLAASRDHRLMPLEEAVRLVTRAPAELMGLKDRGLLKEGWRADLVLFDPATIACGPTYVRHDLPGEEMRLYADPVGVRKVFVNGVLIVEDGEHTGALPGQVLRSGRDTETRSRVRRTEAAKSVAAAPG